MTQKHLAQWLTDAVDTIPNVIKRHGSNDEFLDAVKLRMLLVIKRNTASTGLIVFEYPYESKNAPPT